MASAYAGSSQQSYYNKFNLLLSFCLKFNISLKDITVNQCISFIEFLAGSGLSTPTIFTYISAIKSKCHQFGLTTTPWSHPRVNTMLRACSRTIIHGPDSKQVLTPLTLTQLIVLTNSIPLGPMYKAIFLLAFHGFLRISNLVPLSHRAFDPTRHLTREDVSITNIGISIFIKWSKTFQASRDTRLLPLASIPGSPLCPLQAYLGLTHAYPVPRRAPMFSFMRQGRLIVLSQSQVRSTLSKLLSSLGLNPKQYGFHTFRRSGASLAFSLNIPVEHIKAHGTWSSDAVWSYLDPLQYPTTLTTTMSRFLSPTHPTT